MAKKRKSNPQKPSPKAATPPAEKPQPSGDLETPELDDAKPIFEESEVPVDTPACESEDTVAVAADASNAEPANDAPQEHDDGPCMEPENAPCEDIEVETPCADEPVVGEEVNGRDGIDALEKRIETVVQEIVKEKRAYDLHVNRVNKKLSELTAQRNKMQNELGDLTTAVNDVLAEIEKIKINPSQIGETVPMKGVRGPPLASQDELFARAWENGQVTNSYSGYSQRWKSSNRYKSWGN
jgi:hypothetical protein